MTLTHLFDYYNDLSETAHLASDFACQLHLFIYKNYVTK